jgi:hypothetical protein
VEITDGQITTWTGGTFTVKYVSLRDKLAEYISEKKGFSYYFPVIAFSITDTDFGR